MSVMFRLGIVGAVLLVVAAGLALSERRGAPAAAMEIEIDLDRAIAVDLPTPDQELEPASFDTSDGRGGWVVRIPGGRPIATPAYADGLLFVGGGYGSHEFYAFDAKSGRLAWQMKTGDDGPTAAVVEDGLVAFNTESCTVIVADAKTGAIVWQEWLGDPLMSQPAAADGRLFIAYPDSKGDHKHRMLAAELGTGKHLWTTEITGDVISAPVVEGKRLYFTCFDGTSFCLECETGEVVWKEANAGTSAPLVEDDKVFLTARRGDGASTREGFLVVGGGAGSALHQELWAAGTASYLRLGGGGGVAFEEEALVALDAEVGFGTAPAAAKLDAANLHLGVATVAGGWAFQGSRAGRSGSYLVNGQGTSLNCLREADGSVNWRATARGAGIQAGMQLFSPPSLGRRRLYLASARGHLLAVDREDGAVRFCYAFGHPVVLQPALAEGRVYAGTADGLLVCLATGDRDADGWYAWGGNARHNKRVH